MSSYTITIAPDDQSRATTTLRVEITDSGARITELLIQAGEGGGLSAGQLPSVDISQLLRAVIPTGTSMVTEQVSHSEQTPNPPAAAVTDTEPAKTAGSPPETTTAAMDTTAGGSRAKRPRNSRQAAGAAREPLAAHATQSDAGHGADRPDTTGRTGELATAADTAGQDSSEASTRTSRPYRRAPVDLRDILARTDSVAAVAGHYGVPRYTAQSWIRTLRRRLATDQ